MTSSLIHFTYAQSNCDLSWYFQADRAVEHFNVITDIHMIVGNLYKIPNRCIELSDEK